MARVIVERMLAIRDGDALTIEGPALGGPLFVAAAAQAAARGAHVHVAAMPDGVERALLESSSLETLERNDRISELLTGAADARLRVVAAYGVGELADVAPERIAARLQGRRATGELSFARSASGELRWAVAMHPTPALAEEAGLPLAAFTD